VLSALSDAERALGNYRYSLEADKAQRAALESARRSYVHARRRHELGDIALADLLEAERSMRDAEDAYARAHTGAAIDLVALYKALGGGWPMPAPAAPGAGRAR
jgi:outer membrane protein TolC